MPLDDRTHRLLDRVRATDAPLVVLTGAGTSAESGIPTFRGPEGYWTVGSANYRPEELATYRAFRAMPREVWGWYLYRRAVCAAARPNAAHIALAELESALGDRFRLITQNVDGLHLAAGNSPARTWQIHGDIRFARCAGECGAAVAPLADGAFAGWPKDTALGDGEAAALRCAACGDWLRPHVLWFDECYDEERYRWDSSLRAAHSAGGLLVIGSSGSTNLPNRLVAAALRRGIPLVVVDRERCSFGDAAAASPAGAFLRGPAGALVPALATAMIR